MNELAISETLLRKLSLNNSAFNSLIIFDSSNTLFTTLLPLPLIKVNIKPFSIGL